MTRRPIVLTLSVVAATVLLAGCSAAASTPDTTADAAPGFPVTVESCGVSYTYDAAPERAMLGAPGIVATLAELGVGDSAIGYALSEYTDESTDEFPGLTEVTPDYTPAREFLIAAQPDLFIANDEQQLLGEGAASLEDLASIPANLYVLGDYCVDNPATPTMDVVYQDIANLGKIYGVSERADALVTELTDRVSAAAATNDTPGATAAAITVFDGTVYALSGSYYAAILDALDLDNQFSDLGANFAEISAEEVLAANPEVILVTYIGGDEEQAAAIAEATELFAGSSAAEGGRVYGLPETDLQSAGVRIVDAIENVADQAFSG